MRDPFFAFGYSVIKEDASQDLYVLQFLLHYDLHDTANSQRVSSISVSIIIILIVVSKGFITLANCLKNIMRSVRKRCVRASLSCVINKAPGNK